MKYLSLLIAGALLAACHAQPQSIASIQAGGVPEAELHASQHTHTIRLSEEEGGSFVLDLQLQRERGFEIKQSAPGETAATSSDIDHYDLYVFEASSALSGDVSAALVEGPIVLDSSHSSFSFVNVAANTTGMRYFVGVQALDADNKVLNASTGATLSGAHISLSSGGGDGDGGLEVNSDLEVSSTQALTLTLPLRDARGAQVSASLNVIDGSSNLPPVTLSAP